MPSTTRRRFLTSVGALLGLSGCSRERQPQTTETSDPEGTTPHLQSTQQSETTHHSQTTHPPQTDRPGWVGLEIENNDEVAHEITVEVTSRGEKVTADSEELFARILTLRPQSEPEFNSVVPIPESGERQVRIAADFENDSNGQSASATFTVSADAEYQRLYVTIDRNGILQLTQGTEPSEPIKTTTGE